MDEERSWIVEASGWAGQITVEVLSGPGGDVLSIETPDWSFTFRLPDGGIGTVAAFLRAHAGQAKFAECVAGSFVGLPVRLINDDEFADRLWLRVYDQGQLADFPLVGEAAGWFVAAIAEAAGDAPPDGKLGTPPDPTT